METHTTDNQNYSYTPPVQPQSVVYIDKPRKNNTWKYLLSCGLIFFLISCFCITPFIFLATLGSDLGGNISTNMDSRLEETVLMNTGNENGEDAKIAVVNITGAITYSVPGSDVEFGATSQNIINQLKRAGDDSAVSAVLLRFNSPGGEVVAAEPICEAIKSVSAQKPVYSFIDAEGASLAYLLPNCTKYIYARPEAVTGSIGVILQAIDFYGVLEKLGGKVVFVTNSEGDQKSGQDIFNPNSETYKLYQQLLDETYEYFLDRVYEGRRQNNSSIQRENLKTYADGRIFSGRQAKELNLVDELGQFDDVINSMAGREGVLKDKNIVVVEYTMITSPFDQFLYGMNSTLRSADLKNEIKQNTKMRLLMQAGVLASQKETSKE